MQAELALPAGCDGAGGQPPVRVLIIDDHDISRAALRALLQTEGFEVTDLRTDDDPIAAAAAFRPAVAVVDVAPAHSGGFRIASKLGAMGRPPTVVLTSSAGRRAFGSKLDSHLFVAKADLCRAAIIRLAMSREPRAGTVEQTAHIAPVGRREEVSDAARLAL
jgi:CheY-like chemotaxis protein